MSHRAPIEHADADTLQARLAEIQTLLARHQLVESLLSKQDMPKHELVESLVQKQHLVELDTKLDKMHPADVAFVLEALPLEERLVVWELVRDGHTGRDGDILLEVSDAVRDSLIAHTDTDSLRAAAESLDADELADLAPDLPHEVMQDVFRGLSSAERERLRAAMSYPEEVVGALMDFEMVTVHAEMSLDAVLDDLRRLEELPHHTDQLFVVDHEEKLLGALPINRLLVANPELTVGALMQRDGIRLEPDDEAEDAAQAFERYDLVSAPVVDRQQRLIGRLTVDTVLDFVREEGESEILSQAGLSEEEDIFAPVWNSVKNRWRWLATNLVTAFVASRVIGVFEDSIEQLVALAALMPIVAGIGGNSGNQTITMIVRALALGQIQGEAFRRLLHKEVGVALLNGLVWGGLLGLLAWTLYDSVPLGLVLTAAMTLNLLLAATVGVVIPMTMHRLGRDPALGSSVLITAVTDSGGFFIFLGLATLFLL